MIVRPLTLATAVAVMSLVASHDLIHAQVLSPEAPPEAYVIDVVAEDYAFDAPNSIPSGWVTFRMQNEGENHHFALLSRLPDGKTMDDYMTEAVPPLNDAWHAVRLGEMDKAEAMRRAGPLLPEWFGFLQRTGGPGLLEPGGVSEVTLYLEPGDYFVECYLKTPEGEFHAMEGMIRPFTVTSESSPASPPSADWEVTLTNEGVAAPDEIAPGRHTIAVHFVEQPEVGGDHDLHLARLEEGMSAADIVPWLDWIDAEGFWNPAPTAFVGGTHELPAGSTAYITVDLEPGRYIWLSQMTADQGMLDEFTVQ